MRKMMEASNDFSDIGYGIGGFVGHGVWHLFRRYPNARR